MSEQNVSNQVAARRGELLAELFFQELNPAFISRPTTEELGYDLLVGIPNAKKGINTFAVQISGTEKDPGAHFPMPRKNFIRMAHSNVPGLLLVVNVKQNRLYYGWLRSDSSPVRGNSVAVPLVELEGAAREEFKRQLRLVDGGVAVAG